MATTEIAVKIAEKNLRNVIKEITDLSLTVIDVAEYLDNLGDTKSIEMSERIVEHVSMLNDAVLSLI